MRIARYGSAQDNVPVVEDVDWPALVSLLSTHRRSRCTAVPCPRNKCGGKNGPAWSPVEIENRRHNDNVRAVTVGVFDLDHVPETIAMGVIERVQAGGYAFCVYSTHSNNLAKTEDHPEGDACLRLVIPLSRPALPREWPTVRMAAIRQLEIPADPSTKDLSRLYFLPDAPEGTQPITGSGEGRALDVDALLAAGQAGLVRPNTAPAAIDLPAVSGTTDLDELRKMLRRVTKPESRELVRRILAGEEIAPLGQQDSTLQRVASLVRFVLPVDTNEDAIIELLRPSLQATGWQDGYEHLVEQTRLKLRRAHERRIVRDAERKRENEEIWTKLGAKKAPTPVGQAAVIPTPVEEGAPDPDAWMQHLVTVAIRDGEKLANNHANLCTVLEHAPEWRGVVRFNAVSKQIEYEGGPLRPGTDLDVLDGEIAAYLQRSEYGKLGLNPSPAQVAEALKQVSRANAYDPLRNELEALVWDGTPRIDTFLEVYLGATNPAEYLRLISPKFFISAVARALDPGCKVDTMLIIEGNTGIKKSTAFKVLGGRFFCDTSIALDNKDSLALISQNWIFEMGELSSLKTAKDVEHLKQFLSRYEDSYRPPYGRTVIKTPRRSVFVGTTNLAEFLQHDATGYRRFWCVKATKVEFAALTRDRDQLWAEAVARYHQNERYWIDVGVEADLCEAQAQEKAESSGGPDEVILEWVLKQAPSKRSDLSSDDVAINALGVEKAHITRGVRMDVGRAMRRLGYERRRQYVAGVQIWRYYAPDAIQNAPQTTPGQKPNPLLVMAGGKPT